jgi:hypothetical protein
MKKIFLLALCLGIFSCRCSDIPEWEIRQCLKFCEEREGLDRIRVFARGDLFCVCNNGEWENWFEYMK